MARSSLKRRIWPVVAMLALVVGSAHFAWRVKPASSLVDRSRARTSATLSAPIPRDTISWRVAIDFRSGPAAARWVLHEGAQPGAGYEIHWFPEQLALQIIAVGDQSRILGSAICERGPRLVEVQRRGIRLALVVDGEPKLAVIDAFPPPPARSWGFQAAADLGDVLLSLYDDRRRSSEAEKGLAMGDESTLRDLMDGPAWQGTSVPALANLRLAVLADPATGAKWEAAQRDARSALRRLGDHHPDAPGIDAWLAWSRLRGAIQRSGNDVERLLPAIDVFAERANVPGPAAELPGLLLDHMVRLTQRVTQRPLRAVAPKELLRQRQRQFTAIERLGMAALDREGASVGGLIAGERLHWMLRLLVHASTCLRGAESQPTPAEGPPWLADRWRAFSGLAPRAGHLGTVDPGWLERDPLGNAVDQMIALARFEPIRAMALVERVTDALAAANEAEALAACDAAPPEISREVALTRALLALRGIGRVDEARDLLAKPDADGSPLAVDDPLGFALDRLLLLGLRREHSGNDLVLPGLVGLPQALRWAEPLLSGAPTAPAEAWRLAPERPFEAIAAALVMQEIANTSPDWALLTGRPHFTVPLTLLVPLPPVTALPVAPEVIGPPIVP